MPKRPTDLRRLLLVLLGLATLSALALPWNLSVFTSADAFLAAWSRLGNYLAAFGAPDLSGEMVGNVLSLMLETLAVAVLGTALGLLLAYPLALLAARCIVLGEEQRSGAGGALRRVVLEVCRFVLDALRGVPDFLWAIVLVPLTGINATTGVLALALSVAGIYGKVLSEQWDNIDPQRYQALRSTGASRLTVFLYGIQPLAARAMQSFVLMRFECAVRNASVIGVVGGGGLGTALWDHYTDSRWDGVVTILFGLLLLTTLTDLGANFARRQLRVDPNHPHQAAGGSRQAVARRRGVLGVAVVAMIVGAIVVLWSQLSNAATELRRVEWQFLADFTTGLAIPDLGLDTLWSVVRHATVPLAIGVIATIAATLLASALAYPGSVAFQLDAFRFTGERLGPAARTLRWLTLLGTKGIALVMRGVPEVAWVVVLGVFFQIGVTPCVAAVALHSTGVLQRVFTETLDNVPYTALEKVSHARRPGIFLYGALPRALPDWRTYAFFQFEVNVRAGIALGIVGAGGLGHMFDFNLDWREYSTASSFLWAMVLLTVGIDRLSRWLQLRRLRC
ncbi:MAG: ABC transporter permease subunit [bacterium]|nr:ABC transporter permease subunit [bacterium]